MTTYPVQAKGDPQPLGVIAFDYPPYLGQKLDDFGESYLVLKRAFDDTDILFSANFQPIDQAFKMVQDNQWCASFHPPAPAKPQHTLVITKPELIQLRLHRLIEPKEFVGNELNAKVIAQLRMIAPKSVTSAFIAQGATVNVVASLPQAVAALINGQVDYIYGDTHAIDVAADSMNLSSALLQASSMTYRQFPMGIWFNNQCKTAKVAIDILKQQGFVVKRFTKDTDNVSLPPGAQSSRIFGFY
ncbi:hypothetical protein ACFOD0_09625 [Shewanella intestini]|uniref:Transporter substrate-binding domain-containing protein n=1 Tax=Shewanella intestini TaxID=2017544 RepID=A0ABS5I3X1_9GAMM|nr:MULTISPECIES: hypothetical protein [Shewanella]MBR9728723.1 hypothetical protein [Shewanella intestini]MRG36799.1 hypothetical protein [Shewanella sp. XMDDZSB0408]